MSATLGGKSFPEMMFLSNLFIQKFHEISYQRLKQILAAILWMQELISMDSNALAPEDMRKRRQEAQEKAGYLDERRRCQHGMCLKPWPKRI